MLNPCLLCNGDCCQDIVIEPTVDGERMPRIPNFIRRYKQFIPTKPVHHKGRHGFGFECTLYDKVTGSCKDYKHRPYFCREFICQKALDILEMVQEPWQSS